MVFQSLTMPDTEEEVQVSNFKMTERDMMLQAGWPKMAFIENMFCGDVSNWWIPNHAAIKAMLRSTRLAVTAYTGTEIYLCQSNHNEPSCITTWNQDEYISAIGESSIS